MTYNNQPSLMYYAFKCTFYVKDEGIVTERLCYHAESKTSARKKCVDKLEQYYDVRGAIWYELLFSRESRIKA